LPVVGVTGILPAGAQTSWRYAAIRTGEDSFVTLKTYSGSCHRGAVRFEADVDLGRGTIKCNCSSCAKARSWLVFASPDRYRLVAGADSQAVYQRTPPGRVGPNLQYHFCKNCGIRTPSRGVAEALGGAFHAIQVTLLDDVAPTSWQKRRSIMSTAATITLTDRRLIRVCSDIGLIRRWRLRYARRHASDLVYHRGFERVWPRARRGGA
jgi:hypothetical protein